MKKMKVGVSATIAALCLMVQANAQTPLVIEPKKVIQHHMVLPANTEVAVVMEESITTKGRNYEEGNTFEMSVVRDVMLGEHIVIPKGARAIGWISWLTSKAVFGKSGKMEIKIEFVEVGGKRIPLNGRYRQDGKGNTLAVVAGVAAFGASAGFFITGKSGKIERGTEFVARTREDLPIVLAGVPPLTSASATVTGQTGAQSLQDAASAISIK